MSNIERKIITRLYQYRKSLQRLHKIGFVKVFSENLADAVGVSSAQVRQDFSVFGLSGNKRGGYSVEFLIKELDERLGKDRPQSVVIIGAGNIGKALMNYKGFELEGIKVVALFDTDESKINHNASIPILPFSEVKEFIQQKNIQIAIIAVPDVYAQQVLDEIVKAGIRGVLNFAPIKLNVPSEDFVIKNFDVQLELETVMYLVNSQNQRNAG